MSKLLHDILVILRKLRNSDRIVLVLGLDGALPPIVDRLDRAVVPRGATAVRRTGVIGANLHRDSKLLTMLGRNPSGGILR